MAYISVRENGSPGGFRSCSCTCERIRRKSTVGQRRLEQATDRVVGPNTTGQIKAISASAARGTPPEPLLAGVPGAEWADWCSPCVGGWMVCRAAQLIAPEPPQCINLFGNWYRCVC